MSYADLTNMSSVEYERKTKRVVKPTAKVVENRLQKGEEVLEKLWKRCKTQIMKLLSPQELSVSAIRQNTAELGCIFNEYQIQFLELQADLGRITLKSPEILEEITALENVVSKRSSYVQKVQSQATEAINSLLLEAKSVSVASTRSRHSDCEISEIRVSSIAEVRAKAAATKVKVQLEKKFLEEEMKSAAYLEDAELALNRRRREEMDRLEEEEKALSKRKREEQARLKALQLEGEAEMALASLQVVEEELNCSVSDGNLKELPTQNVADRVENYVMSSLSEEQIKSLNQNEDHIVDNTTLDISMKAKERDTQFVTPLGNVNVPRISPVTDAAQFIVRREIMSKKIEKFDDSPENFHTWKSSFEDFIKGVDLTASEQLSLMLEYTTNESKKLVRLLKNAFISRPSEGLKETWKRLEERFGSEVIITQVLLNRLDKFPVISSKNSKGLQELGDLLMQLQCAKIDGKLKRLERLDDPVYIIPVVEKLPESLKAKWQTCAFEYKSKWQVDYPPFDEFSKFVQTMAAQFNDPLIHPETAKQYLQARTGKHISTANTSLSKGFSEPSNWCIIHERPHPLKKCKSFKARSYEDRQGLLRRYGVCFRCVQSCEHVSEDCQESVTCLICKESGHDTSMHPDRTGFQREVNNSVVQSNDHPVDNHCTEICEQNPGTGKSCAKICLAYVYAKDQPYKKIKTYVVIDDQSNYSLARSELFNQLGVSDRAQSHSYTLKTCSGVMQMKGRRADGLMVESIDKSIQYELPTLTECNNIPSSKNEIATSKIAAAYPHLQSIASQIPPLDKDVDILLLLGRDLPPVHKVRQFINGPPQAPWAQRLDLGWVVMGSVCLDGAHIPTQLAVFKTQMVRGRPSIMLPCSNQLYVKPCKEQTVYNDSIGDDVFITTPQDNHIGLSIEDKKFLSIMEKEMRKDKEGSWEAPLPLREEVKSLPRSRDMALRRLNSTRKLLMKNAKMKQQYVEFMRKVIDRGYAEVIDSEAEKDQCWYLPHFGVYHPQKREKIRVVFDAAAECGGVSLNKLLMSGPDLTNNLLGVLLRFRQNPVAVVADIEQMFYRFKVKTKHRDLLRFLWYEDDDDLQRVKEYRMTVHIFGSTSSPAVANYGLRKTAEVEELLFGADVKKFIHTGFYVDDGLTSTPSVEEGVDLLTRAQAMLATANLRLHKFASNRPEVLNAFPQDDRATELHEFDFSKGPVPIQRSLGVLWDLHSDAFVFKVAIEEKPFSRRGVLSLTNSLYDPLGMVAPVIIKGKMLMRAMFEDDGSIAWDTLLPEKFRQSWEDWRESLLQLKELKLPRCYGSLPISDARSVELHIFSDASEMAISAVGYLKLYFLEKDPEVSFVMGKAKLTPKHATSVPRLELCAAVLAIELSDVILRELTFRPNRTVFHTDSKVVLGYIKNETRRFYVYVANRVEKIRGKSSPSQWHYISTDKNPADLATRSIKAKDLADSSWLRGPSCLRKGEPGEEDEGNITIWDRDPEVRRCFQVAVTSVKEESNGLGSSRFERFSDWNKLIRAIAMLITFVKASRNTAEKTDNLDIRNKAKIVILQSVQQEMFGKEVNCLKNKQLVSQNSKLAKLKPYLDNSGLLRVGGRIQETNMNVDECHPVILPREHHVSLLIVRHYHEAVSHQGRIFTFAAVRSSGFWIIGGNKLTGKILNQCLKCKMVRGHWVEQEMANLPADRVRPSPPFSYVGVDVFGPWEVCARRTRGGIVNSKRWAVLFACMSTRAIHIEVIENMDASCFINALRRFMAIRGPVKQFHSDCGTNFKGALSELKAEVTSEQESPIQRFLLEKECEWVFNPPHASHFGGSWERLIGMTRKILNSMLKDTKQNLTHEILTTLMAEVSIIVNSRPLVPVLSDPTAPEVLTPAALLTQKSSRLACIDSELVSEGDFRKQWRVVQALADRFWTRWKREYLPILQERRKWRFPSRNLAVGDIVLLRDDSVQRNDWPLARVINAPEDKDGKVRKVTVITTKNNTRSQFRRPVNQLVLLLKSEDFL